MGLRPTNSDENPVGQAHGLRRPPRPPGCAFNKLEWVFDRARVLQDPLLARPAPQADTILTIWTLTAEHSCKAWPPRRCLSRAPRAARTTVRRSVSSESATADNGCTRQRAE